MKRQKRRRCPQTGNRSFRTEMAAVDRAAYWIDAGAFVRVYRCEHCSEYHLTSQPKRGRRAA